VNHADEWVDWVKMFKRDSKGPMNNYFNNYTDKEKRIYDWIEWVVNDNQPLIFCEKKTTRAKTKLKK